MTTTTYITRTETGQYFTRASGTMHYTHSILVGKGDDAGVYSWHTSRELASSARNTVAKHYSDARVVEVEAREGGKAKIERQLAAEAAASPESMKAASKAITEATTGKASKAERVQVIKDRAAKANKGTAEEAAQTAHDELAAKRTDALAKAREARAANADKPAPVVNGVTWGLSGKHHGLVEGSTFEYRGRDKKAPEAKGPRLTMKIVDRVYITGVDASGTEQMRVHIAGSFWATKVKAPKAAKKA